MSYTYNEEGFAIGVEYKRKADGSIDWRNMIGPEHFVVNHKMKSKLEKKYKKAFDQIQPTEVSDKELLILISGIKEVAKLRGLVKKIDRVNASTGTHASVTVDITWIPNKETAMKEVTFSGTARACVNTTEGDFQFHLDAIAENRAFIRAVRNFLNIHVVGKDEIGGKEVPDDSVDTNQLTETTTQTEETSTVEENTVIQSADKLKNYSYLQDLVTKKGMSFDEFKQRAVEKHTKKLKSDPNTWTGFNDTIPSRDVFYLTELLTKAK